MYFYAQMKHISLIVLIFWLSVQQTAYGQACTTLGQNPSTAFPVCGTSTFVQNTVPICGVNNLVVPGCTGSGTANYQDKNPFWYRFTCYRTGTLGFVITPNDLGDDYDWQLYDITGRNPNDVYTVPSLVVTGNWAGTYGATGASASGVNFIQCASDPAANENSFAQMPTIIEGRQYLLLVSHFTNSQSGYTLSFGGGTASITDPTDPKLGTATANCEGNSIHVTLNKKMKCRSLTGTGTEFSLSPGLATVISATGTGCNSSFDLDALTLTLSNPLPPGNYQLIIRNGSDGNTLQDNCDRTIPQGDAIPLTILPIQPTPMDSLTKIGCAPQTLELVFSRPIRCNSIDPSGRDFSITGTYPVTISGARGECVNGVSSKIFIDLATPLYRAGNFQLRLLRGPDGSTIIDECGQETPAGASLPISTKDTVNADFGYTISLGCQRDTVQYIHNGANGVNSWLWTFDFIRTSNQQNPQIFYGVFGDHLTELIVSNGVCSDTSSQMIFLPNTLKAGFEATQLVCPNDLARFRDTSIGNIVNWSWDFGNGQFSNQQQPPAQVYGSSPNNYQVPVTLTVTNDIGCTSSATVMINVLNNCYIAVPSAFTPNGDGLNDFLYPLNAYKARDLSFSVFNRLGERVFYTNDWTRKWDGRHKGRDADMGTYVWILTYTNTDTNKRIEQKGSTVLIRQ